MLKHLPLFLAFRLAVTTAAAHGDEARECFEWFETLGYPDVKAAPWVEVTQSAEGGQPAMVAQGFLLEETRERIALLPLDLRRREFPRKNGPSSLALEEKPFAQAAAEYLAAMRAQAADPAAASRGQWGLRLGMKAQAFVMAQACHAKGLAAEARAIFDITRALPPWSIGEASAEKPEGMRKAVARELAHAATWQAVVEFGGEDWMNPGGEKLMPRTQLLATFREIERRFPENPHAARVKATITMLEQMVEEDAKHPPLSREEIARLPVKEQAREWIFQLRDQNGRQFSQPGWCDVFGDVFHKDGNTPAHELVKIGYPAAPQLIEALRDKRFSRSVGFGRGYFFSHRALTVAECAQQVLDRIARQSLSPYGNFGDPAEQEKALARYREEAETWWKKFQAKGEAQSLADNIGGGQIDPREAIKRLKEINPGAVEAAVLTGAKNSRGNLSYQEALGELKTFRARECLAELMRSGDTLRVRTEAARQLWLRDDSSAIPAMIAEWKKFPRDAKRDADWGRNALIQILIVSGELPALQALAEDWEKRNTEQRFAIIAMLGQTLATKEHPRLSWGKPPKIDSAAVSAAESIFLKALEDPAHVTGRSGSIGEYSFSNPRICDYAVFALSEAFPGRFTFTPQADGAQREAERLKALELLRASNP